MPTRRDETPFKKLIAGSLAGKKQNIPLMVSITNTPLPMILQHRLTVDRGLFRRDIRILHIPIRPDAGAPSI